MGEAGAEEGRDEGWLFGKILEGMEESRLVKMVIQKRKEDRVVGRVRGFEEEV